MPEDITLARDSLWSGQLDARQPKIIDQVFRATPALAEFSQRKKAQMGSERIHVNLEYGENTTIQGLGKGGTISLADTETVTTAYYEWRTIAGNITRYRTDDKINKGPGKQFDLVEVKIKNLIKGMSKELEQNLFSDGTDDDDTVFQGLELLLPENPTADNVGNIPAATSTWWRNDFYDMASDSALALLIDKMRDRVRAVEKETGKLPDVIMTTYELRDTYEEVALELRTDVQRQVGDYSYQTVAYKGIPFVPSSYATAGTMRFLTWEYIYLMYDPDLWFTKTQWKEPVNQPMDRSMQIVCDGNLVTSQRRAHSTMFNIGAATGAGGTA